VEGGVDGLPTLQMIAAHENLEITIEIKSGCFQETALIVTAPNPYPDLAKLDPVKPEL